MMVSMLVSVATMLSDTAHQGMSPLELKYDFESVGLPPTQYPRMTHSAK
jgi:hypothetical protein